MPRAGLLNFSLGLLSVAIGLPLLAAARFHVALTILLSVAGGCFFVVGLLRAAFGLLRLGETEDWVARAQPLAVLAGLALTGVVDIAMKSAGFSADTLRQGVKTALMLLPAALGTIVIVFCHRRIAARAGVRLHSALAAGIVAALLPVVLGIVTPRTSFGEPESIGMLAVLCAAVATSARRAELTLRIGARPFARAVDAALRS